MFIGIDWGTTNARALLFGRDGAVTAEREEALGVGKVTPGGFRAAFDGLVGDWREKHPTAPVLLSGMVGSRQGWLEVPYLACPANLTQLHRQLVPVPGLDGASIVPGLCHRGDGRAHGSSDVMRGEELQLLGLGANMGPFTTVCIPGTHTKWVRAEWPLVREFHTTMTGELFAAILGHTLFAKIARPATRSLQEEAFFDGVQRSAEPHGLTRELFGIRADLLMGKVAAAEIAEQISGLLIGTEIRYWRARAGRRPRVALLASRSVEERYLRAFRFLGIEAEAFNVLEITAAGFAALMRAAQEKRGATKPLRRRRVKASGASV